MKKFLKKIIVIRSIQGLIVVALIGVSVFLVNTIEVIQEKLYVLHERLAHIPQELSQRTQLARDIEKHRHDLDRLQGYIITRDDLAGFIGSLEDLGKTNKISVQVINVQEQADAPAGESMVPVTLTVEAFGNPKDLLGYLYRLEHVPYLSSVPAWDIRPAGASRSVQVTTSDNPDTTPREAEFRLHATVVITMSHDNQPS